MPNCPIRPLFCSVVSPLIALSLVASAGCDDKTESPTAPPAPASAAPAPAAQPTAAAPAPSAPALPVPNPSTGMPSMPAMGAPVPLGAVAAVKGGERYQGQGISWVLPAGWSQREASGMRYATLVPGTGPEVSVTRLGGGGGGMLANINRWRGQVFLPPLNPEDLAAAVREVPLSGDTKATIVDITGPKGRILGALIPVTGGQTWFFKAQVEQPDKMQPILADFDSLVKSLQIAG